MAPESGRSKVNVTVSQYRARQIESMNAFCTQFNQAQTENKMHKRPNKIKVDQDALSSYLDKQMKNRLSLIKQSSQRESDGSETNLSRRNR